MHTLTKEDILANWNNPKKLEKLYRGNKVLFRQEFNRLYTQLDNTNLAEFWNERLNFTPSGASWGSRKDWILIIVLILIAGLLARLPEMFSINEEYFYTRNISFIVFPVLMVYFFFKNNTSTKPIIISSITLIVSVLFINLFPLNKVSDTLLLSCIHLPLFLWFFLGYSFAGGDVKSNEKRLDFLRYNGDLVVIMALLVIAGLIMSGVTIGLFSLIGFKIEKFYFDNIVKFGAAAIPIVGTFIIRTNPHLVDKVSPVIARLFTPLVLITLTVYLIAIFISGKNPYNDREFLLLFNLLLIGVMALILFSVAETFGPSTNKWQTLVLLLLSGLTILVNGIALSAILFRIAEWGFTPNRVAVLGSNMLILIHLFFVAFQLLKTFRNKSNISEVGKAIAYLLPVYFIWAGMITFLLPLIFNFK